MRAANVAWLRIPVRRLLAARHIKACLSRRPNLKRLLLYCRKPAGHPRSGEKVTVSPACPASVSVKRLPCCEHGRGLITLVTASQFSEPKGFAV